MHEDDKKVPAETVENLPEGSLNRLIDEAIILTLAGYDVGNRFRVRPELPDKGSSDK